MLKLSIHRAAPGMVLAAPVLHPEKPEHILLRPGAVLEASCVERMLELDVRTIYIEYPPTAHLMRMVSPAIITEQGRLAAQLSACLDAVADTRHADFDFLEYLTGVRSLVHALITEPAAAVFIQDIVDAPGPLASHSFNVGLLSLLMGLRLDGYLVASRPRLQVRRARGVENLAVGALLHDIGMLRLEPGVADRYYQTGDQSDELWRQHTTEGYALVHGRIPPTAAAAVLNHHQRLDGSGFPKRPPVRSPNAAPRGLVGREIHIFTRVVAVADAFENARRPFDGRFTTVPTVRALRATAELVRGGALDPVAFRALLTVVPAFAPGSTCTLSDGNAYVVTGWHPNRPCRPTVARINGHLGFDDGPETIGEPIDLRYCSELRISLSEGEDVSADLFDEATPGEFDSRMPIPSALVEPLSHGLMAGPPVNGPSWPRAHRAA